jgi:outer membrane receptor protein involved in Fe transport
LTIALENTVRRNLILAAYSALAITVAVQARADAPQPAAGEATLDEIVVTASKREEKLIDVPISISAFGRESMDLQGVRDINDVTRLTPGLANIPTSTYGGETIAIRGIYSNTGASTTGIYIDDTPVQTRDYLGVVNNAYPLVFDLDRVEVLRGPQGTLFGAGSEGGTVRFITPTPSLDATHIYGRSDVGFTTGGQPSEELGMALETPIIDNEAGLRASVWGRHLGGYIDRVSHDTGATVATDTNGEDDVAARITVKVVPSASLTITPSIYFQRTSHDDLDLFWPDAGQYKSWYGIGQPEVDQFVLPALTVNYDFDAFSVKSISSFFDRHDDRVEDYAPLSIGALTGGTESFVPGVNFHERSDTINRQQNYGEELRVTSRPGPSRLSWVAGLFFYESKQNYNQTEVDNIGDLLPVLFPGYTTLTFYGQDQLPGHVSFYQNLNYKTEQRAAFGEVTYRVTDRLKATVGVRVERSSFSYDDFQNGPFVGPTSFSDSGGQSETPVTPRFNLSYALDEGQVYATAAKGYRTGGVNEQVPVTCASDLTALGLTSVPSTYQSDTVWSYEVGAKGRMLDRMVEVNGSLYWVDWSGIQSNIPLLNCGFGYNANLGRAVSKGFDFQIQAHPLSALVVTASLGYDNAAYSRSSLGEIPAGTSTPTVLAKDGDGIGIPGWQASLSTEYSWVLTASSKAYVFADYQYTGNYQRTGSEGVVGYNPYTYNGAEVQLTGLRAGVRRQGWDVSAYASNLFNEKAYLYFYQAPASGPDGARAETPRPRTIGLTATYRY